MSTFSRVRRALVFAAALSTLVLSSGVLPPGSVSSKSAYPYYAKEITYYSDSSRTQVVGFGWIYCDGSSGLDGTSTPYRTEVITDVCCRGGVPC